MLVIYENEGRTFQLECEIVCEMSTFVVSTQETECFRVPDLEGPQV